MWNWLANRVAKVLEDEREADIEELFAYCEELEAKLSSFRAEIWEYVDGTLQPLNKRIAQRLRREGEKELNSEEVSQKHGGLMTAEQMRQHGFTQQNQKLKRTS
jgi:hypothetical protein